MLFAVLGLGDLFWVFVIVFVFAGGRSAVSTYLRPRESSRLRQIEQKVDLILTHLGIEYVPSPEAAWREVWDKTGNKINAIKAYREEHDVGLVEAKKAVEEYIESKSAGA